MLPPESEPDLLQAQELAVPPREGSRVRRLPLLCMCLSFESCLSLNVFVSTPLPVHPLPDVRRTTVQSDALRFAHDEEAHDPDVHQRHLIQVEHELRAVLSELDP